MIVFTAIDECIEKNHASGLPNYNHKLDVLDECLQLLGRCHCWQTFQTEGITSLVVMTFLLT